MAEERKRGGTSVDQILSSIRRIISEESPSAVGRREESKEEDILPLEKNMEILELTECVEDLRPQGRSIKPTQMPERGKDFSVGDTNGVSTNLLSENRGESLLASFLGGSFSPKQEGGEFGNLPSAQVSEREEKKENLGEVKASLRSDKGEESRNVSEGALLSNQGEAQVRETFMRFSATVQDHQSRHKGDSGRTVEDLVMEVLQPQIKEWLDIHLPHLVERLVREEIERLSTNRKA